MFMHFSDNPIFNFLNLIVEEKSHKMHIIISICNNMIMVGTIDNLPHVGTVCDFQKL
jgi:hypothetical protein